MVSIIDEVCSKDAMSKTSSILLKNPRKASLVSVSISILRIVDVLSEKVSSLDPSARPAMRVITALRRKNDIQNTLLKSGAGRALLF